MSYSPWSSVQASPDAQRQRVRLVRRLAFATFDREVLMRDEAELCRLRGHAWRLSRAWLGRRWPNPPEAVCDTCGILWRHACA